MSYQKIALDVNGSYFLCNCQKREHKAKQTIDNHVRNHCSASLLAIHLDLANGKSGAKNARYACVEIHWVFGIPIPKISEHFLLIIFPVLPFLGFDGFLSEINFYKACVGKSSNMTFLTTPRMALSVLYQTTEKEKSNWMLNNPTAVGTPSLHFFLQTP